MTLVAFSRCLDGAMIASDRKATNRRGMTQSANKSMCSSKGFAFGCSGDADAIQALIREVSSDVSIDRSNSEDKIREKLSSLNNIAPLGEDFRAFAIYQQSASVAAVRISFTGNYGFVSPAINDAYDCIGEDGPCIIAKHYLKQANLQSRDLVSAAPLMFGIMKQACSPSSGTYVGSQEDFGFDIIMMRIAETCYAVAVREELSIFTPAIFIPLEGVGNRFAFRRTE